MVCQGMLFSKGCLSIGNLFSLHPPCLSFAPNKKDYLQEETEGMEADRSR